MIFQNIEAEQAVLGAILLDNRVYDRVADILKADFFADPVHAELYGAIVTRIMSGNLADPFTMRAQFEVHEGLRQLGGPAYLVRITSVGSRTAARDYAGQIVEAAARRALRQLTDGAASRLSDGDDSLTIKSALQAALQGIPEVGSERSSYSLLQSVTEAAQEAVTAYQGATSLLKTGVPSLDKVLKGLAPGNMCLLAGATSMGKTSLALEIAKNVAFRGEGVVFVSLEMTRQELATRLVSSRARVPYSDLRDPTGMHEDEFRKWIEATRGFDQAEMRIVPRHVRDLPGIQAAARRAGMGFKAGKPSLVVVDYAQLVKGEGKGRYEQLTQVSIGLKDLAKMLDCPVIALCQLSREIGSREDKRPQLSDIKDTGQFENDADQVVFCHREGYWLERQGPKLDKSGHITDQAKTEWRADCEAVKNIMELIVRKNRHGRLATAEVGFHDATCRFWELKGDSRADDWK